MRHRRRSKKLSRNTSNRKALMRSLVLNLLARERIFTTLEKAKEASSLADRVVTMGKRNTITSKKNAISTLGSKSLINKLFDDIAPRFTNRAGGYTRVLQLAPRKGDGAKMAILELTERKVVEKPTKKKPEKRLKETARETATAKKKPAPAEEKPDTTTPPKTAPKAAKVKVDEEKRKEKAKSEKDKLTKGFFKGLRRYFRGKST